MISFYSGIYGITLIYEDNENIDQSIQDSTIINQLYHITQEALNNSIKHSNASIIEVILTTDESEICLQISDNGNGDVKNSKNGLGLNILKYRTNVIDGNISIISNKNKGTKIICRVPIIGK